MANPGMDAVHTAKFHITDMLQWSRLLTTKDTPPCTPHPASCLIDYHVGAKGLQVRDDMVIDRNWPNHNLIIMNQLQTLSDHKLVDEHGRVVEIFDSLGNLHPELLAESAGVGIVIGSGEPSPESSRNGLDCGETFTFQ